MTVQEFAAGQTASAAEELARAASSTRSDKVEWKPLDHGRSVLDQISECVAMNDHWTARIAAKEMAPFPDGVFDKELAACSTLDSALERLKESETSLIAAINAIGDKDVDAPITLRMRGGMTLKLVDFALLPARNMTYHCGQICYIQCLYGDTDFH